MQCVYVSSSQIASKTAYIFEKLFENSIMFKTACSTKNIMPSYILEKIKNYWKKPSYYYSNIIEVKIYAEETRALCQLFFLSQKKNSDTRNAEKNRLKHNEQSICDTKYSFNSTDQQWRDLSHVQGG